MVREPDLSPRRTGQREPLLKGNITSFMHHYNRRTPRFHVPPPHPGRRLRAPCPARAPRSDAGALLVLGARRAALLGVLHRPHPEPEHAPRLPRGRPPLRRVVRTPRPRPRASSSTSRRSGCSSTGSSSARSCPSTPRARSGAPSTSSRPARPRSSPPRRRGPCSTASMSQRWWVFATARSSASSSTASRA